VAKIKKGKFHGETMVKPMLQADYQSLLASPNIELDPFPSLGFLHLNDEDLDQVEKPRTVVDKNADNQESPLPQEFETSTEKQQKQQQHVPPQRRKKKEGKDKDRSKGQEGMMPESQKIKNKTKRRKKTEEEGGKKKKKEKKEKKAKEQAALCMGYDDEQPGGGSVQT